MNNPIRTFGTRGDGSKGEYLVVVVAEGEEADEAGTRATTIVAAPVSTTTTIFTATATMTRRTAAAVGEKARRCEPGAVVQVVAVAVAAAVDKAIAE